MYCPNGAVIGNPWVRLSYRYPTKFATVQLTRNSQAQILEVDEAIVEIRCNDAVRANHCLLPYVLVSEPFQSCLRCSQAAPQTTPSRFRGLGTPRL